MWCTDPECESCEDGGCLDNATSNDQPVNGECSCGRWHMTNLDDYVLGGYAQHMHAVQLAAHRQAAGSGEPMSAAGASITLDPAVVAGAETGAWRIHAQLLEDGRRVRFRATATEDH